MFARFPARRIGARWLLPLLATVLMVAVPGLARAQIGSDRYSSIVIDAGSGNVVSAANPDELRFPASLTKMMTLYMLFEALRDHRIGLTDYVPVSPTAAAMPATKLYLPVGGLITVEQAIMGLVTRSANDAACALGEMLGGDEERFAQMMTVRAHALGMSRTNFGNASGLPDWNQVTTARDMATLARHLIQDFPAYYHYFSTPSVAYAGHVIRSHQHLLVTYPGADGLKTGYTDASGFNVVTSALRSDTRLIGVVMGAASGGERDNHMAILLNQGFERMGVAPPLVARSGPAYRVAGPFLVARATPPAAAWRAPAAPLWRAPPTVAWRGPPTARGAIPVVRRESDTRGVAVTRAAAVVRPTNVPMPLVHPPVPTRTAHGVAYLRYPG